MNKIELIQQYQQYRERIDTNPEEYQFFQSHYLEICSKLFNSILEENSEMLKRMSEFD
jgi:hypothetical protein